MSEQINASTSMLQEGAMLGWEDHPTDKNVRIYHSRAKLLEGYMVQSGRAGAKYVADGVEICSTLAMMLSIPGVQSGEVTAYQLAVCKSPLFHWHEIDQHVFNFLLGMMTVKNAEDDLLRNPEEWLDKTCFQNYDGKSPQGAD